ncbi:hypothetical protein Q7P37_002954 [Cladosporium fusiforme]
MAEPMLLTPTLHVEVQLTKSMAGAVDAHTTTRRAVAEWIQSNYATVNMGKLEDYQEIKNSESIRAIDIADFTGPHEPTGYYSLIDVALDVQTYVLRSEDEAGTRRRVKQDSENVASQTRIMALPNVALNEAWDSLVFDDGLPSRLLRYLVRMVGMMGKPGLNLATFNWNKICLLHGPPGSGKSTLCRALAQKLSIRTGDLFPKATLVEVNANAMLSKYFGESGKLIESTFENVQNIAKDRSTFVVVVIDEVETIASSRQRVSSSGECSDGLRATNQLLTALDRLRNLPNILVCCTSNLIEAIDSAFLDRVDIKQYVPAPSSSAVYNIFRSCLNELVRTKLLVAETAAAARDDDDDQDVQIGRSSPPQSAQRPRPFHQTRKRRRTAANRTPSSPKQPTPYSQLIVSSSPVQESVTFASDISDEHQTIPTLPTTLMTQYLDSSSPGQRIWALAQKCQGLRLSGRTLRRLPVLGLAMYTWGGKVGMAEAVGALEKAVEEESGCCEEGKGWCGGLNSPE